LRAELTRCILSRSKGLSILEDHGDRYGVYSSTLLSTGSVAVLRKGPIPPAMSTLPFGKDVAVASERAWFIVGVDTAGTKLLVAGS